MDFFDTFPFTKLQGKNRGLDWVIQKIKEFQKAVDDIPETVSKAVSEITPDIATDKTLTLADIPADSKTVGNRFSGLRAVDVHARPDTWTPTAAEVGAAPSGYGLGESAGMTLTSTDNCNNAFRNGFYYVKGAANAASPYDHVMIVVSYGNSAVHQIAFLGNAVSSSTYIMIRKCYGSGWNEWEYQNPACSLGVEYRTTERWHGAAVYTKLVDLGAVTADCNFTIDTPGIAALLRAVPNLGGDGCVAWDIDAGVNSNNQFYFSPGLSGEAVVVYIKCGANRVGKNLKVQIWYRK